MKKSSGISKYSGEVLELNIPKGREPFINTPVVSLGKGKEGIERFWISSCNAAHGSTGVLFTEYGDYRILRFKEFRHSSFYSVAQQDRDTLWLCGDLARVVKLDLNTFEYEEYPTGAPPALVFPGMCYDKKTGYLFAAAFPPPKTSAFTFDTKTKKTVRLDSEFCTSHYMRFNFPNGDGTYTFVMQCPKVQLLRWNPENGDLTPMDIVRTDNLSKNGGVHPVIADDEGNRYLPGFGWWSIKENKIMPSDKIPQEEATWFAKRGNIVFGVHGMTEEVKILRWDIFTGEVTQLCTIPNAGMNVNLTETGKIIVFGRYGDLMRYDAETGNLELNRRLPTDNIAPVDCICRIDDDRLIGTPFITQRFWELNIKTGKGYDCGRAAPGGGEVLLTWNINKKIYMAAYTGAELMEYDPEIHPHYPENPRIVCRAPGGLRPVAAADDGRRLWYGCSHKYGNLGGVLVGYDTKTGENWNMDSPLPDQIINSLWYDKTSNSLLAGSCFYADCQSCPPSMDHSFLAWIDADSLKVSRSMPAPKGTVTTSVYGPMGKDKFLVSLNGVFDGESKTLCFTFNRNDTKIPELSSMGSFPESTGKILYTGKLGVFILHRGPRVELWDMRKMQCLQLLYNSKHVCHVWGDRKSVYINYAGKKIIILENVLKNL